MRPLSGSPVVVAADNSSFLKTKRLGKRGVPRSCLPEESVRDVQVRAPRPIAYSGQQTARRPLEKEQRQADLEEKSLC
jgi:hypothetical protein